MAAKYPLLESWSTSGIEKTSEKYYSTKDKIESLKPKNIKHSSLYNIKNTNTKRDNKKLLIRITSIATVTVLLSALANYELRKRKIDLSDIVYITSIGNNFNDLDNEIRMEYPKFEEIVENIIQNEYSKISNEDVNFINKYVCLLARASTDNNHGKFYDFNHYKMIEKDSPDSKIFLHYGMDYTSVLLTNRYKTRNTYEFCARACNLLFYSYSAIEMNKNIYMPRKEDLYNFSMMKPLSKIIFLNELKGALLSTDFAYDKGEEPYWWLGMNMSAEKVLNKIEGMLQVFNDDLKGEIHREAKKQVI